MLAQKHDTQIGRSHSIAHGIRQRIEAGGENYWKPADFPYSPATAVTQTLSRLTRSGVLQRVSKGIYYHPRTTVFGKSQPSRDAVLARRLTQRLLPAGLTAANLLGFTTQNPARREYATTASAVAFADDTIHVTTRRPESWKHLSPEDAAVLDFLRGRGLNSELSEEDTRARLLTLLRAPERFQRLAAIAPSEPARVRAILGAIGQEVEMPSDLLSELRESFNQRSRFDFGALRGLKYAREWQAK
jgi:hypothetical protein